MGEFGRIDGGKGLRELAQAPDHSLSASGSRVDWLEANRPVLQKTFTGSIGLLCGKDRIPVQHSALHLAGECVGPALGGKDVRLDQRMSDGFGGDERIRHHTTEEIALAAMPSWTACSRPTNVSLGTK